MEADSPSGIGLIDTAAQVSFTECIDKITNLKILLKEANTTTVLTALRQYGYSIEGDGFDEKNLDELRVAIKEIINIESEKEIERLVQAVNQQILGAANDNAETIKIVYVELLPVQVDFVKKAVEAGYEQFKLVNRPLIGKEGVPPFPSKEAVLSAALNGLTREQVAYMMEEGRVPFSFQVKLVAPNNRFDLAIALLDGQPRKNRFVSPSTNVDSFIELLGGSTSEEQTEPKSPGNVRIYKIIRDELQQSINYTNVEWRWSFYQDYPIYSCEKWDNNRVEVSQRRSYFKAQLPEGMKGTDLFTWSAYLANILNQGGEPSHKNIFYVLRQCSRDKPRLDGFTILDELSFWPYMMVRGQFDDLSFQPAVETFPTGYKYISGFYRANIDGSIKS